MPELPGSPGERDRGLSEVIGYVLIFSLIFLTVGFVTLSGLPTLDSARQSEQVQNAERAFDILDNNLKEIYKHGAPSRATEISADDGTVEIQEPITMNVSATKSDGTRNTTGEISISPIAFTGLGDTEFIYAGGAVFRQQSDSSFMIQEPPFTFSDQRAFVTIPRTFSKSQRSTGGGTVLVRATSASRSVVISDPSLQNREYDQMTINVTSPRQDTWQEYIESTIPNASCSTPDGLSCTVTLGSDVKQTFVTVQGIEIELEI